MSNLQHIKGSRTRVLNTFPTKTFGNDGDIVISRINGKGVFLCSKAGGMWYVANQMQELSRIGKASIKDLSTGKLTVNSMVNARNGSDRYVINDKGSIKYRTGEQIIGDLPLPFNNIDYKTAYCSLGQYSDKDTCESNGGTWYYSENDSHDSISSTAENQLLTVGQSIGGVDAESTLTYDGSTLDIKYNSDYDDNWQTSATTNLLKLSYDSSNNAIFNVSSSGRLTIDCTNDITLDADGGDVYIKDDGHTHFLFDCNNTSMTIYDDADAADLFSITVGASGVTTMATVDDGATAGHLILDVDGDITLDAGAGNVYFEDGGTKFARIGNVLNAGAIYLYSALDNNDYCFLAAGHNGILSIATVANPDADTAHITISPNGDLSFNPSTGAVKMGATDKLYFDGGTHTYIQQSASDILDFYVGAVNMLKLDEANDKIQFTGGAIELLDTTDAADKFTITVAASGATTIATVDDGAAIGHLTLDPDGHIALGKSAVFEIHRPAYGDVLYTANTGNNTDIDFRTSNKAKLTLTGGATVAELGFVFPDDTGNFVLVLSQDGSGTGVVTDYKVYTYEGDDATSHDLVWAGGSDPTLTTTASKSDIISILWDNHLETAYATITHNF